MSETINLFTPFKGKLNLKNRIVMAPMTRCRAIGNLANPLIATYYSQRSTAGLIITEGVAPSPNGLGYARIPGIFSPEQTESWKTVTQAVHAAGGQLFMQLMHTGRVGHSANLPAGAQLLAPSAINADSPMWTDTQGMQTTETPKAMTADEIKATIEEFAQAAANAIEAGFDGVELHGANGYLLEQFLNAGTNQRTDEYGGSIENRARFVIETARAVVERIGADKTGIRLSPYNSFNNMPAYDDTAALYDYLAIELNKLDLAYLHLIDYASRATEEGRALLQSIRTSFKPALILNAGYTKERGNLALANNEADLISFGTPFIANPDLPHRLANDIELAQPETNTFYTADAVGFTDYPAAV
ncbi:alkene reductase [Emticicia sp. 21SJ11W-3]|uniref:alkene reductase n=1 Tax=Emticicia sp. 21SJ11W-3 TaxID=2916755 RepID=UPI00209CF284|nr:alkene reductase [Emticicia sp. 21SJ11W-3]UTA66700.1 alkene reductase [Emticicia sp. 21SJ11W-3]